MSKSKWLEARSKHLTATAVPLLFGFNKFKTVDDLITEKIHGIKPEFTGNEHTRRGKIMEGSVLDALEHDLGIHGVPFDEEFANHLKDSGYNVTGYYQSKKKFDAYFSDNEAGLGATPDAYDAEDHTRLIECKAPQSTSERFWKVAPPADYVLQVHTQLSVVPYAKEAILGALFASSALPLLAWRIQKSEEITRIILEETARFWKEREDFKVDPIKSGRMFELVRSSYESLST